MNMEEWRASRKPIAKPKDRVVTKQVEPEEKSWDQVWRWLKPRLDKAGRTQCEFVGIIEHKCSRILDPVHSKKRNKIQGLELYHVAIGCRTAHNFVEGIKVYPPLGRRVKQKEMEEFVLRAIKAHGGLILP